MRNRDYPEQLGPDARRLIPPYRAPDAGGARGGALVGVRQRLGALSALTRPWQRPWRSCPLRLSGENREAIEDGAVLGAGRVLARNSISAGENPPARLHMTPEGRFSRSASGGDASTPTDTHSTLRQAQLLKAGSGLAPRGPRGRWASPFIVRPSLRGGCQPHGRPAQPGPGGQSSQIGYEAATAFVYRLTPAARGQTLPTSGGHGLRPFEVTTRRV